MIEAFVFDVIKSLCYNLKKAMGMHFFKHVPTIKLPEIVRTNDASGFSFDRLIVLQITNAIRIGEPSIGAKGDVINIIKGEQ
jgi:hypothetical protein